MKETITEYGGICKELKVELSRVKENITKQNQLLE